MMAQPRRPHQYRRQPGEFGAGGRAGHDPHLPQSRVAEGVEFSQPVGGTLGIEPGPFLVMPAQHIDLGAQPGDLGIRQAGRLGDHQPAQRPAQLRDEGRLEQRRWPGLPAGRTGDGGHTRPSRGAGQAGSGGQRDGRAAGAEHPDQTVPGSEPARPGRAAARARREQQRPARCGGG
jgi:hypothetical protein